jgi:hypothetical protein
MAKASRELEVLVAKIQQQLAPQAEVLHDVMLDGRATKRKRQIDVLVRERIGQYEISIIIDCKDYNKPVDVKGVEEFYGLLSDVGAQKGVLVCPKGFTGTAKTRAEFFQIELYSPVDTDIHKWRVRVTIPALCDFRNVAMSFQFMCSAPVPFQMANDFYSSAPIFDEKAENLGTMLEKATKRWDSGAFPTEVGEHHNVAIFDTNNTLMDNGYGMRIPVQLSVSLQVTRELYYGQLPVPKISGFKDEMSGKVITNAFQFGLLDPEEIERDWTKIASESEAPMRPVITMYGQVAWGQDGEKI